MKTARRLTAVRTTLYKRRKWYVEEPPVEPDREKIAYIINKREEAKAKAAALAGVPTTERPQGWAHKEIGTLLSMTLAEIAGYETVEGQSIDEEIPTLRKQTLTRFSPDATDAPILAVTKDQLFAKSRRWDGKQLTDFWQDMIDVKDVPTLRVLSIYHTSLESKDSNGQKIKLGDTLGIDKLLAQTERMLMSDKQLEAKRKLDKAIATRKALKAERIRSESQLGEGFAVERGQYVPADTMAIRKKTAF